MGLGQAGVGAVPLPRQAPPSPPPSHLVPGTPQLAEGEVSLPRAGWEPVPADLPSLSPPTKPLGSAGGKLWPERRGRVTRHASETGSLGPESRLSAGARAWPTVSAECISPGQTVEAAADGARVPPLCPVCRGKCPPARPPATPSLPGAPQGTQAPPCSVPIRALGEGAGGPVLPPALGLGCPGPPGANRTRPAGARSPPSGDHSWAQLHPLTRPPGT